MKHFRLDFVATPDTIDELGHVNNAVWVQWLQRLATSHWDAAAPAAHHAAYYWVVVRHEIDYLRSLGPDARVTGHTWVADAPRGAKFDRHSEFIGDDGRLYLRAKTSWALLDRSSGRPIRVTDDITVPFLTDDGWRPLQPSDLPAVDRIAQIVHVDHPEDMAVYHNRLALYPQGCMALERDGQVMGYMVAHPWSDDAAPPKLNQILDDLPVSDCLYLHDIALLPETRGMGAGRIATAKLVQFAKDHGYRKIWLTAVSGADSFWSQQGFRRVGDDSPYGEGTMVMALSVAG